MQLDAGYRIVLAPRFAMMTGWSERVRLNSGVIGSEGCFFPRDDWRPLSETERTLLFTGSSSEMFPDDDVGLFSITERLRTRWWNLAGTAAGSPGAGDDWFTSYVREIAEFAQFKGLPLPPSCCFEVVISPQDHPSTRIDASSEVPRLAGLLSNITVSGLHPAGAPNHAVQISRMLAGINLGEEPTSIVLVNLSLPQMAALLALEGSERASIGVPDDVARRFLNRFPEYPLVRLPLNPGEGFWLPAQGIVFDGYTIAQTGIAVMLVLKARE